MRSIKKYNPNETGQILNGFISRYVNQDKLRKNILLWNGKVITIGKISDYFAKLKGADFTEPICEGLCRCPFWIRLTFGLLNRVTDREFYR